MSERYINAQVRTYSTGIPGRHICTARTNHFVVDDMAAHNGPGEAVNAAELFMSGITACATLMMERLAKASSLPLRRSEVTMEGRIDTEAQREGPAVLDRAHLKFVIAGLSDAQAKELVETYKRR